MSRTLRLRACRARRSGPGSHASAGTHRRRRRCRSSPIAARREKLAGAFAAIRDSMPEAAKRIGAPGLAWGVIVDGELAASGAVGLRDVEANQPATPQSIFRIASMTKSFTALAILALRDEGKLSLDDAVTRHIPEFAGVDAADQGCARHHHPPPAHALRGISRGQPLGRSATRHPRPHAGRLAEAGAALFDLAWHGLRVLELRLRAAGPHRLQRVGHAFWRLHPHAHPDTARACGPPCGTPATCPPIASRTDIAATASVGSGRRRWRTGRLARWAGSTRPPTIWHATSRSCCRPGRRATTPRPGPVRRSSVREMQQGQRHSDLSVFRATPDAPLTVRSSAYAYGLGSTAGLPLPDDRGARRRPARLRVHACSGCRSYGVGVIVLANVTYAGAGGIGRDMLEKLAATGALQPRTLPASAPLLETRAAVTALVNRVERLGSRGHRGRQPAARPATRHAAAGRDDAARVAGDLRARRRHRRRKLAARFVQARLRARSGCRSPSRWPRPRRHASSTCRSQRADRCRPHWPTAARRLASATAGPGDDLTPLLALLARPRRGGASTGGVSRRLRHLHARRHVERQRLDHRARAPVVRARQGRPVAARDSRRRARTRELQRS